MIGRLEGRKDVLQELTQSGAGHVGRIAVIVTGAVREVAREVGDWLTDVIEMREAAGRAQADASKPAVPVAEPDGPASS
jgi:hypothetical protein